MDFLLNYQETLQNTRVYHVYFYLGSIDTVVLFLFLLCFIDL